MMDGFGEVVAAAGTAILAGAMGFGASNQRLKQVERTIEKYDERISGIAEDLHTAYQKFVTREELDRILKPLLEEQHEIKQDTKNILQIVSRLQGLIGLRDIDQ